VEEELEEELDYVLCYFLEEVAHHWSLDDLV
jgi:hypothetical protein